MHGNILKYSQANYVCDMTFPFTNNGAIEHENVFVFVVVVDVVAFAEDTAQISQLKSKVIKSKISNTLL